MISNSDLCAFARSVSDWRGDRHCIVEIWDLVNCHRVRTLTDFKSIPKFVITADGQTLITYDYLDTNFTIWDIQTGEKKFSKTIGGIGNMVMVDENKTFAFSRTFSSEDLATAGWKTEVEIWNIQKQKSLNSIAIDSKRKNVNYYHIKIHSHSGMLLCKAHDYTSTNNPIDVWDIAKGKNKKCYTLNFPKYYQTQHFAFNPDGSSFATAIEYVAPYNPKTSRRIARENPRERTVRGKAITLWKLHQDPALELLDRSSRSQNDEYESIIREKQFLGLLQDYRKTKCFAFSPDGKLLVSSCYTSTQNEVKIWDIESHHEVCSIIKQEKDAIKFVGFNQEGNILYTATDKNIKAWGF